jgi:hypothetical protein
MPAAAMRASYTGHLLQPDGPEVYVMDGDEYPAGPALMVTHPGVFRARRPLCPASPGRRDLVR